ncbi:hypothetical protein B0H16DRAFT_1727677 [Mycena metata]|uniref:Uncharacterized protein n=1 Tax=Mycena metata TaxID=1033252 RepID=A0AAD7IKV7_9AGAR|nr:hypothetical protein B0H16DRAFT_1727677 [Mycena metata]
MHPSNLYYPQLQQQSWSYGPPAPFALVPHPYYPSPFPYIPITPIPAPPLLSAAFSPDTESDKWAIAFAGEFFNGIVPGTASGPQRRAFKWPIDVVTPEDRLLVVIRAIRKAGFPTIGSFLAALFERKYNKHSSVYNSVASFLRGAEDNTAHHPVTIVDLIFHHTKSQRWTDRIAEEPSFSLPRYALRPSLRLDSNLIPPGSNSTRNALIDFI